MSAVEKPGRADRVLLALAGLVLLVFGGPVLAIGLGATGPSWWIHQDQHDVLLSAAQRTHWRGEGWWWPAVIAGLAVLLLIGLWWLSAVLRRRRLAEILVDTGDGEEALLRGPALEAAAGARTAALDGVERAEVRLTGRREAPRAGVRVLLEPYAAPGPALQRISDEVLAQARDSAGLERLPAEVQLRAARHRPQRVQ
ncbi:alkaline shock response membrane anchor protein AmaP [Streptomyces sp. NPDC058045]|uniref:alkaline shock response membrane anchor protein AmaP n=1 Tax=Streptomyces sp. NPDC058045 TaxID=3346311 RepID=UPI0036EAAA45